MKSVFFAFLLLLPFIQIGHADDQFLIFGDESEPPKSYLTAQGDASGVLVDAVRDIAKRAGVNLKIELYPWNRAYKSASYGLGLIMGLSKTPEREKIFDYTDVMFYDDLFLVTHSNRIPKFTSIHDLSGKTLALNIGSSYGTDFDAAIANGLFHVVRVSNREGWYKMLMSGRVDGVVAAQGIQGVDSILQKDDDLWAHRDEFQIFAQPIKRDPNYIGVPKALSTPDLMQKLNHAISQYWRARQSSDKIALHNGG